MARRRLAAGLASESQSGSVPYGRCEALPSGKTFPAACCRDLQYVLDSGFHRSDEVWTFYGFIKINEAGQASPPWVTTGNTVEPIDLMRLFVEKSTS
jgi:hypothetical protein